MSDLFLDAEDVEHLTGRKRPSDQIAWLREHGYAHEAGPDREVSLENRYGGAAGYRLDFYERGKTVEIHVRGGEVVRICQRSD